MESFKADLHCHSTCSDGSLTPAQLIALAKAKGLNGLSITDHDGVEAYPSAFELAAEHGIQMIPGAEFSSHLGEKSVHILAYSFDTSNPELLAFCKKHRERRYSRNEQILQKLSKEGYEITLEELLKSAPATVGRPHIAKLLVEKGYVPDIVTAFKRHIGDGKKCYVPGVKISIEETLAVIHSAKGLAVLAHPHLYQSGKFVRKVLEYPFDGLETRYARLSTRQNAPWIALAQEKNLFQTGGSDFHGAMKPAIDLGSTTVGWENFEKLLKHYEQQKK